MKLFITFPISGLFAYAATTICSYFENTAGIDLFGVRCAAAIVVLVIICLGLPASNQCTAEEGAC